MAQSKEECIWLHSPKENQEFIHKEYQKHEKIYNNALEAIGKTPMIRLNKIPQSYGLKCEVLVKCEFMNVGGSVKDRIGYRMVEDAEKLGKIKPGYTLIEATSGNAGIGLALSAAVKGYKMVITMPEKMSQEKINVLKGLGAEVIRTPTELGSFEEGSHIMTARKRNEETENSIILDQYNNPSNPLAHYDQTGEEIWDQCDGKLDYLFAGTGTGGTITGCASRLKEHNSNIKCVGVDPYGSILAQPENINEDHGPYQVEGIGYDFIPNSMVRKYVDDWVKVDDKEGFEIARRLIKEEGLLCGGSSGSAVWAALEYAKKKGLDERHRLVVILPDSVRNYVSKFLSDDWMIDYHFLSNEMYLDKQSKVHGKTPKDLGNLPEVETAGFDLSVEKALERFVKGEEIIPIMNNGKLAGVVHESKFTSQLQTKKLSGKDNIKRTITKECPLVDMNTDLSIVQRYLERYAVVLV